MRPISSPAIEVQNTVSPMISCGEASASTCASMPRSRKISMVRWLVMCARGVLAVHLYLVIMMLGIPSVARHRAADPPAGPDPTISTSVSTVPCGSSVSASPSSNAGIVTTSPAAWCFLAQALPASVTGHLGKSRVLAAEMAEMQSSGGFEGSGRRARPDLRLAPDLACTLAEVLAEDVGEIRGRGETAGRGGVGHGAARRRGAGLVSSPLASTVPSGSPVVPEV